MIIYNDYIKYRSTINILIIRHLENYFEFAR